MPTMTIVAKVALPLVLLVGGGAAWAAAGSGSSTSVGVSRAWIDSPMNGERLEPGPVKVSAHASAPGGIEEIELDVDGVRVASAAATGTDRLNAVVLSWNAATGVHALRVRGRSGDGWGDYSEIVTVQVGDVDPAATPTTTPGDTTVPGETTTTGDTTTTSDGTETTTTSVDSTTSPDTPTTSTPPAVTAVPPTATTAVPPTTQPPLPPPRVSVTANPRSVYPGSTITFTATGAAPGRGFTLTIRVQESPGGAMKDRKVCFGSTCTFSTSFFSSGVYQYEATVLTEDGVRVTTERQTVVVKMIG